MVFSSPAFLFLYLPLVLALFHVTPRALRTPLLFAASALFYAWGEGRFVLFLLASVLANHALALWLEHAPSQRAKKLVVTLAVLLNVGALAYFKYTGFLLENLRPLLAGLGLPLSQVPSPHLPIGVSFITFEGLSYVIDVYRGTTRAQKNPIHVGFYVSFFPHLIAGPVLRYADIATPLDAPTVTWAGFESGVRRFIVGLAKKVLVANVVGKVATDIFALSAAERSPSAAWLGIVCYALQIYFDFSGYSDMAIGLGRLFGFELPKNFDLPYAAQSIQEFWHRWHISLSTWFRDYVYIPLGGNRVSQGRQYVNLVLVFLLCGLWHGASWSFVVWGAFHGLFLVLERLKLGTGTDARAFGEWLRKARRPLRHVYVWFVVLVGWVFFRADTLPQALQYLQGMAGWIPATSPAAPLLRPGRDFVDRELLAALVAGLAFATLPWSDWATRRRAWLDAQGRQPLRLAYEHGATALHLLLLVACLGYLASGTFNPFIYFRF